MDLTKRKAQIAARIKELTAHLHKIADDLDQPLPADLEDQAIDLEDDEVLERLGAANQQELGQLQNALKRIDDGSYGTCAQCGEPISDARLDVLPQTMLCRTCAAGGD